MIEFAVGLLVGLIVGAFGMAVYRRLHGQRLFD